MSLHRARNSHHNADPQAAYEYVRRNIGQQFLVKLLHMTMVSDVGIEDSHLTATDTSTHVRHTIVVADGSVLVVWIGITSLCRIPHDLIGVFCIAANKSAAAGSRYHLVAVERQHAVLAESSENLAVEARTHALSGILDNRNTVFVGNSHDLVNLVRHTIESHRDNRLRIFARFFFSVNDCLLKKRRIHIPRLRLRTDKHRFCAEIGYRMRRCAECERLYTNLVTGTHSASQESEMNCSRAGRQAYHLPVKRLSLIGFAIHERLQILLESIHIRSHRHHPIGVKCLFHIFLFPTLFLHMRQTKVNCFSFLCHSINLL